MMILPIAVIAVLAKLAATQKSAYGQCGGINWSGETTCVPGWYCVTYNSDYAQCMKLDHAPNAHTSLSGVIPITVTAGSNSPLGAPTSSTANSSASVGGPSPTATFSSTSQLVSSASASATTSSPSMTIVASATGAVTIASTAATIPLLLSTASLSKSANGTTTSSSNSYLSVIASNTTVSSSSKTLTITMTSSSTSSSSDAASSATNTTTSAAATTASASSSATGRVRYAGVNISGFEFGCLTNGTCPVASATDPSTNNGIQQVTHFVNDDGLNAFQFPVSWQYLVNAQLGGPINSTNLAAYDKHIQKCISAGAQMCITDVHNYARWNATIIGQGGPTNAQFASLWSQLATKYLNQSQIVFGLMHEPHDLNIGTWSTTLQAAVTAIRQSGASNTILIAGTDYAGLAGFIIDSGPHLLNVTNPDNSTNNIIFDTNGFLDENASGTHSSCTTNNSAIISALGDWLRANGRQAILSATGGGPSDSTCLTNVCQEFVEMNRYSDVFLGFLGWSAGAFKTTYVLSETPILNGTTWNDQPLVTQCIVGMFKGNSTGS